jgi:putative OPT family oligopeptide transporter
MAEPTTGFTEAPDAPATKSTPAADAPESGHVPYVPDNVNMPELTWPSVLAGAVLGIVFGASSLYLVLKVGLTVSASIPVAVLSITLFRLFSRILPIRRATILENNIVQTTGSAGESIAFGVGVTMPALFLLGFEMSVARVMTVAVLGGLLGILMMIPLRRAFIVKQHGRLKYPEGTACADVLIVGEQGGASAKAVFTGFGLAFVYAVLMKAMKLWKDTLDLPLYSKAGQGLRKGVVGGELDPALLGVGYIIGPRIASIMVAGGVLAYLVMVPAIAYFGEGLTQPLAPAPPTGKLIKDMSVGELRGNYILYIGAGAVATGGIISMFQALPVILGSVVAGLRDLRGGSGGRNGSAPRTERDLPMILVILGSLALVVAIAVAPSLGLGLIEQTPEGIHVNVLGLVASGLIVLLGFLFVTVSSRLTGEVGSSSNPISGMTVAALLITCLVFVSLGRTDKSAMLTALTVAAVVCIASSNGGTTSQDLKTGFLVGSTPRKQQIAILIGALASAFFIGYVLLLMNNAGTVYSKKKDRVPDYTVPAAQLGGLDREKAGGQYGDDPALYYVFHVGESEATPQLPAGKYLADEHGKLVYFVDPAINGKLNRTDDGHSVKDVKYQAPKTQLMEKIISGIFNQRLPWGLVLLGVLIAVTLELTGVPSLPFAVGVYLPLESSTPIFLGGAVRWLVERVQRRRRGAALSESESEMSPGTLLSTGYIAGASIAGVVYAFVAISPDLTESLSRWQYRRTTLERELPVEKAFQEAALSELGLPQPPGGAAPKEEELTATYAANPWWKRWPWHRVEDLSELVAEFKEANESELSKYVNLPPGTKIHIPQGTTVYEGGKRRLEQDEDIASTGQETLGQFAQRVLGSEDKAASLLDNNSSLKLPEKLPAGAVLKVPQRDLTALLASGALVVFLALVGLGLFLRSPTAAAPPGVNGRPPAGERGPTEGV